MARNKSGVLKTFAPLAWTVIFFSVANLYGGDGKMPITTSSEKALEAYYEGLRFLDRSQPESARAFFEKAVQLDSNFIMAYEQLRRCAPTIKASQEYLAKVRELAKIAEMSEGEKLFFESQFAAFNGDRPTSLKKLEKLVGMYPKDERVLYQLGLFYFGTDDAKTVEILGKAEKINREFVPIYNIKGYGLRTLGKYDEAEHAFRRAIELDPENPNAYDSYAELLLKLGRFNESIANYDKALEREPLFPSAQIGVAANLLLLNKHNAARTRLSNLMKIAPHDGIRSGIHWALAVTYADEGNLEKALQELEMNYGISRKNQDSGAMAIDLRNMAAVLIEMGKLDEAAKKFQTSWQVIQNDPNQSDRFKVLAKVFSQYGEGVIAAKKEDFVTAKAKALAMDNNVVALNSPPFFVQRVHELKGIIALEQGQYDEALTEFKQADATEVYNMYRMALALESKGNREQALDLLQYVVNYNSPLNFNYSFVRHEAVKKMENNPL